MITITPEAAIKITSLIEAENMLSTDLDVIALRIAVSGGGCNGMSYKFDFVEQAEEGDALFNADRATIVVDPISLQYLDGSTIDYVKTLMSDQFVIKNPNVKTSCGCGSSFGV